MNSISENNNCIIATSYQATITPVTSMTTSSKSSTPVSSPSSPKADDGSEINKQNVSEIWRSNFSNNINTRSNDLNIGNAISWATVQQSDNNNKAGVTQTDKGKPVGDGDDESDSNSNASGNPEKKDSNEEPTESNELNTSPSHHARRPMNAFLIFCKKHRPIVRKKYPALENRGVTRILGEWWSLLDCKDKDPYTQLAKQYKDAFFTANPNFKWYKLPAPPLRTLPARPTKSELQLRSSSPSSPNATSAHVVQVLPAQTCTKADFTPGKLADESQLGGLSSLIGTNYPKTDSVSDKTSSSNECLVETPPKPLKKRFTGPYVDNNNKVLENNRTVASERDMANDIDEDLVTNGRKSYRKGKGNRYADIMVNGKLIKMKRQSMEKDKSHMNINNTNDVNSKLDLNHTIKKLEERITNNNNNSSPSIGKPHADEDDSQINNNPVITNNNSNHNAATVQENTAEERTRTTSEMSELSDMGDYTKALPSFDLDARISQLQNLSYEMYVQRKKEMKKRKLPKGKQALNRDRSRVESMESANRKRPLEDSRAKEAHVKPAISEKQTGSKKRKNKHNITHLENNDQVHSYDLSGLATLAEMAAFKEKIDSTTEAPQHNNNYT